MSQGLCCCDAVMSSARRASAGWWHLSDCALYRPSGESPEVQDLRRRVERVEAELARLRAKEAA